VNKKERQKWWIVAGIYLFITILCIAIFAKVIHKTKIAHGEEEAAVWLIPAVFGSWPILLLVLMIVFWIAFGQPIEILHIRIGDNLDTNDAWNDTQQQQQDKIN